MDQVKLRGFRIELGEVEAALADMEGVAQAAARRQAARDARRGTEFCTFVSFSWRDAGVMAGGRCRRP